MTRWIPRSSAWTEDEEREAYAAPVLDPLWMLGRQLQTGGWAAGDGGSVVRSDVDYAIVPLMHDGILLDAPLEPRIEAEPLPAPSRADGRTRARWGVELVRLLRRVEAADVARALTWFAPFSPPERAAASARFAGRVPDADLVRRALRETMGADGGGPLPPLPGLRETPAVRKACQAWLAWLDARSGQADDAEPPSAWQGDRLEHTFTLTTGTPGADVTLVAPDYDGTGIDWYTSDRGSPLPSARPIPVTSRQFLPTPVEFAGMAARRHWTFEDGNVDLDLLDDDISPLQAVLRTYAHQYSGDWHLLPLTVPPGALRITALRITDTFGTTFDVADVAELDDGRGPWRFLELSPTGEEPAEAARAVAGLRILLPSSPAPLQGPVLEDVLLARDEIANLAWVIERRTLDADGYPVDRHRRHLVQRPASDPAFSPARRAAGPTYRLATALPDYWYPLVPARTDDGSAVLALAEIPAEVKADDVGVRGTVVPPGPDTRLADEEVPRDGVQVTRRDRLLQLTSAIHRDLERGVS